MINQNDSHIIKKAAKALKAGHLVAVPTETVYGLAGDACSDEAVEKIFAAKGRPSNNPLIVHIHSMDQLYDLCHVTDLAKGLVEAFWPGPLTIVLSLKSSTISSLVTAGHDSLAVRMPAHPAMRHLLKAFDGPLAAPSANPSNYLSPTTAEHVRNMFMDKQEPKMILDGGLCQVGLESTIIDARNDVLKILRPGSIGRCDIERVLDRALWADDDNQDKNKHKQSPRAPGQLKKHYAPRKRLRMNVDVPKDDETWIVYGNPVTGKHSKEQVINIAPCGDLNVFAHGLFDVLHQLDQDPSVQSMAIMPVPDEGIGIAINDRLKRAAHASKID